MAVLDEGASGDAFEALADVRQVLRLQNHVLMVADQSQSHAEQDLGALVEQTVPDPQHRLMGAQTERVIAELLGQMIALRPLRYLHWQDVDEEADEPARDHQSPHDAVILHEPPHRGNLRPHQLAQNLLIRLQTQHGRRVVI